MDINSRDDITIEDNNTSKEGNLFLPIQVENYLNVKICLI